MKQTRQRLGVGIALTAGLLMGAGCGGTGKTFYLDLQQKHTAAQYQEPEPVRIVIEPFEDRRLEKSRLGLRTHLWGGVTYFNVAGERLIFGSYSQLRGGGERNGVIATAV